jgi:hypothetical protein
MYSTSLGRGCSGNQQHRHVTDSHLHKALSIVGLLNVVVFAAFLFGDYGDIGSLVDRPDFWMLPTLEWPIYFAIVGYLLFISIYVWRKEKGAKPSSYGANDTSK